MARIIHTRAQRLAAAKLRLRRKTFDRTTREVSNDIQRIILGGVDKKKGYTKTAKTIALKHDLPEKQAETIVKTETHEIRGVMQEIDFEQSDPSGKAKYRWQGPTDRRTSAICAEIKKRTKNGVPLERLKEIIREVARKHNPKWEPMEWVPHPNCRHVAQRLFK